MTPCRSLAALTIVVFLTQCGSRAWQYEYQPGRTAVLHKGLAVPLAGLPAPVLRAVQAGNEIAGKPYRYGGGHRSFADSGYDCSGAVSYVLHAAGHLSAPTTSKALRRFGRSGEGQHLTVYARRGHAFIVVAGLRFDTGYHGQGRGPHWTTASRPLSGFKARHPSGL